MHNKRLLEENPDISITIRYCELVDLIHYAAITAANKVIKEKEERIFSRNEVIKKFGICSATLWRWEKMGLLRGKKIGNRVFYTETEVNRLVQQKGGEL